MARVLRERDKDKVQNIRANHVTAGSWDDWVPQDRVRKFTPENKELAAQLHNQMKLLQQKAPKSVGKGQGKRGANGSEISSQRDSEERMGSVAATGRGGPRRNRDYDLEHVSVSHFSFLFCLMSFGSGYCEKVFCLHLQATDVPGVGTITGCHNQPLQPMILIIRSSSPGLNSSYMHLVVQEQQHAQ